MTLQKLSSYDTLYSGILLRDIEGNAEGRAYLEECLQRFYNGDFGIIEEWESRENMAELRRKDGYLAARYKAEHGLKKDIRITCYFSPFDLGIEFNGTRISYAKDELIRKARRKQKARKR